MYINRSFKNVAILRQLFSLVISSRSQRLYLQTSCCLSNFKKLDDKLSDDNFFHFPLVQPKKYDGAEVLTQNLPSVTRVLGQTKSVENQLILEAWKKKMIKQMGEDGFKQMQTATLSAGTAVHSAIQEFLNGTPLQDIVVDKNCIGLWKSVQSVLQDVSSVLSVEHKYVHPHLKYYGYADCVAKYRGRLCSIDWKTSKKVRYSLKECYDDPLQVAAYAGAVNCTLDQDQQISQGLVVKIYHDGQPASPFLLNDFAMEFYWMQWLKRLNNYKNLAQ